MAGLNIDLWTCDIATDAASPQAYAEAIVSRVEQSWDAGADVVVFPEFSWMGLEQFTEGADKLRAVSDVFWNGLWPEIFDRLNRMDKAVVLGSVPYQTPDGALRNRVPIISGGDVLHQDKIHLTPWEGDFSSGTELQSWTFLGHRLVVLICLDVEIPELSAALRGSDVDLVLVPSATESLLGVERVGRCANARAVELGCCVAVSHLVGLAKSELVDENVGKLAFYTPSQSCFIEMERETSTPLLEHGFHRQSFRLDSRKLAAMRASYMETNPARVSARTFKLRLS